MLVLAEVETELKNRFAQWGNFTQTASLNRLRYAQLSALRRIWRSQDWDFKKSTATIVTTDGNLGPYDAPSGMVRFCQVRRLSVFGYADRYILAPIIPNVEGERITPFVNISDGKLYFVNNPGNSTLTLNYVGAISNAIDDTNMGESYTHFPDQFIDAVLEFAEADLLKYIPGMGQEAQIHEALGKQITKELWEDATVDVYQKTIAPKGLNQKAVDFVARQITVLGSTYLVQSEDD